MICFGILNLDLINTVYRAVQINILQRFWFQFYEFYSHDHKTDS
ncbi:hypothetical protein APA_406 [Pseudanabaena sp. lw0831]|nr:hypothetical protein APA_406 [Pseudanabaena sp. lw0831]